MILVIFRLLLIVGMNFIPSRDPIGMKMKLIGMNHLNHPNGSKSFCMTRAIGMNIGMIIPGIEVGCSAGTRLWMNHLGFVCVRLWEGARPPRVKQKKPR